MMSFCHAAKTLYQPGEIRHCGGELQGVVVVSQPPDIFLDSPSQPSIILPFSGPVHGLNDGQLVKVAPQGTAECPSVSQRCVK
jgi:hypothetical protein